MAREKKIKQFLCQVAPLLRSIAIEAQDAAASFAKTEWAQSEMSREASINQMAGVGRWRLVGDRLVLRQGELPDDIELSTSDEEQNQGRYYLCASTLGVVLTVRRKPHKKDEEPEFLQLQIEAAITAAPVDYGDKIVIYFDVGPKGTEPVFHVTRRGKVVEDLPLVDLIERPASSKPTSSDVEEMRGAPLPESKVRSVFDKPVPQEGESADPEN